jgi:cytochrome P450
MVASQFALNANRTKLPNFRRTANLKNSLVKMDPKIVDVFLFFDGTNGHRPWALPLLFGLFLFSFWNLWWRPRLEAKKPLSSLPMPPKSHWLFGHIAYFQGVCFLESFQRVMFDHCDENGRTAFWIGPLKWFSCSHWEDARAVLHAVYERQNLPLLSKHVNMFIGPKQIGFLKGKEWRYHRGALVRSLKPESMRQSKSSMTKIVSTLVASLKKKIGDEGPVKDNVHKLIKMITIDSFGKAAFMTDFGCCESLTLTPFSKAFDCLMKEFILRLEAPVYVPWNFFYSIPTKRNREMMASRTLVRSFLTEMIKLRREKPVGDILSNLIAAHNESAEQDRPDDGHGCSDEALKDVMMSMLLAGYDTTSTAVSYALYLIGKHPEVEANCLQEIRSSAADTDVDDYCYCQAVFQETLRLYSPAPQILRTLQRPLKMDNGLVLPAGMFVALPIFHIQRSERTFQNALTFRPDRWVKRDPVTGRWTERQMTDVDTSSIAPGNREACFDFSAGARSCPGKRFAFQLGTITMVGLMKELKFTSDPGYEVIPSRCGPLQAPKGGVQLTISIRDEN